MPKENCNNIALNIFNALNAPNAFNIYTINRMLANNSIFDIDNYLVENANNNIDVSQKKIFFVELSIEISIVCRLVVGF